TRMQGGQRLIDQQNVQLKLNKMYMLTEALRSYVLRVAWEHDNRIHSANAGLVMNYSCDVIQTVCETAMEIAGGAGGQIDPGIEKLVRDSFIWTHLAGDSVQRLRTVRRHLIKAPAVH
ncbi:MAG: acyl-CoA/acyl-ACP dehydrogenase, partial [Variibacter sp.]|nr:acyl-CoA/acyl-ACP dehydrogenase [Variibacter sp.]